MVDVGVCTQCGREVVGPDTFCGTCGARVTPAPDGLTTWVQQTEERDLLLDRLRETTTGEYEVRGVVGRGGMASVFVAYDLTLNRRVALKAMHPGFLTDSGMRERFRQEARLAARLDHPNIVTVHAVKERGGIVFFDLKLVEGTSLDRLMRFLEAPLPVDVARWTIAKIADALQYAHEQSVVHRDIKPANVMVEQRGDLIVTDFGIAKAAESPQLTQTGTVVGTPAYMSPEQCLGKEITATSDQYSLGILAYELLTGAVPFTGSMLTIQLGHVERHPPAPRDLVPAIPESVSAAVMRMIAKKPESRFKTLGDAADAILEGLTSSDTQMRRELATLVGAMPQDGTNLGLPQTPRSPTPAAIGEHVSGGRASMDGTVVADRVQDADTEVLPLGRSGATPAAEFRARVLPLGAVIAASIAIVAIIGVMRDPNSNAPTAAVADSTRPAGGPAGLAGTLDSRLDVADSVVSRIGLNHPYVTLRVGDSLHLKASAYAQQGDRVNPRTRVRWMSDDTARVIVSTDGWIHARAATVGGPVSVIATADNRAGAAMVTVIR